MKAPLLEYSTPVHLASLSQSDKHASKLAALSALNEKAPRPLRSTQYPAPTWRQVLGSVVGSPRREVVVVLLVVVVVILLVVVGPFVLVFVITDVVDKKVSDDVVVVVVSLRQTSQIVTLKSLKISNKMEKFLTSLLNKGIVLFASSSANCCLQICSLFSALPSTALLLPVTIANTSQRLLTETSLPTAIPAMVVFNCLRSSAASNGASNPVKVKYLNLEN